MVGQAHITTACILRPGWVLRRGGGRGGCGRNIYNIYRLKVGWERTAIEWAYVLAGAQSAESTEAVAEGNGDDSWLMGA